MPPHVSIAVSERKGRGHRAFAFQSCSARNAKAFISALSLLAIFSLPAAAQEFRATIVGTVTDQQGAVVPAAKIEVRNPETNVSVETVTNESGNYVVPFLPVGHYNVSASARGFKRAARENLELRVGDRLRVDFRMELGTVSQEITVSASAELLETATASKGQVIDSQNVQNLPLLGRNPFMLAAIAAGVQYTPSLASRSNRPFDNGGMDSFSINGGRQFTNEFLLDGVPDTNTETGSPSNLSFVPSPDATEEFKVQTNSYDSQYGRTGGGVINVSLKSGANRLHGSLYDYWRNDVLNANDFASNLNGVPRSAFRWNQPGLVLGGPVYLPKVYDGRNRTFFMYSWEDIRSSIPFPQTLTVPTLEQRAGDFSKTLQANGQPITIFDPLTTRQVGNTFTRQPFAGNRISPEQIDPVARRLLDFIPKPNAPGTAAGFFNFISSPNPRTDAYDQHIIRIDQVLNSRHKFFSRYVRGNRHEVNGDGGFPHPASTWYTHWRINQGANFDLTSTLSPSLVLNSRVGYIRHQFAIARYADGFDPGQLVFPTSLVSQLPRLFFPQIEYTDYSTFGHNGSVFTFSDTYSFSETANKVISNHSLKFGGEFRVMRNNQQNLTSSFGSFSFNKGFTQRDPLRGDAASGNAFASLLLGFPASGSVPHNVAPAYQNHYWVLFLQDDWRVNRKWTLNLGLRWDYESPQSERYEQQNRGFDPSAPNPFKVPGTNLKGGLLFTDPEHRLPFIRDLNNFQPRFGVAYQVRSSTVVRAGYGIYYLPTFNTGRNNGFSVSTPFVATVDGGLTPAGRLSDPYPNGIQVPPGRSLGLATLVGQGFTYGFYERTIPYVHQFSLGFQQEFPWRILIDASYVGSRTRELQTSKGINEISAEQLQLGPTTLLAPVSNPFQGLLPGTSLNGPTVTRSQLLQPFPQFTGITEAERSIGQAWYNALQVRVEKRFSNGLSFLASYTVSKTLEAVGYLNAQEQFGQLARVLTNFDGPQRFIVSGDYDLPFFKTSRGVSGVLMKGWAFNWIVSFQSGLPVDAPGSAVSTGIDPSLPDGQRTRAHWFNTCTVNLRGARQNCLTPNDPVAFTVQPPFTLRTLSTRFPNIRTERPTLVDFSVFKAFDLRESLKLQFRAEAFNLLNTPWFGAPNTNLGSPNFGVVSPSQANDPRNIQLAIKLVF